MNIKTIDELKDYFRYSKDMKNDGIFVDANLRREWMLNHETTIIRGKVYGIDFKNMKGGVWLATISSNISPNKLLAAQLNC